MFVQIYILYLGLCLREMFFVSSIEDLLLCTVPRKNHNLVTRSLANELSSSMRAADSSVHAEVLFGQILRLLRRVESGMKDTNHSQGMSGSQLWAVWLIASQPGLRISDMAQAMQIHHSTASNLLDKIEARSLIRRERQVSDTRVVRLWLTQDGEVFARHIPGPVQAKLRQALEDLGADERVQLSATMSRLLAALGNSDSSSG